MPWVQGQDECSNSGLSKLLGKGPDRTQCRLCGPANDIESNMQILTEQKRTHIFTNICIGKILCFVDTDIWILYNFHMPQNIFLLIFFVYLKW